MLIKNDEYGQTEVLQLLEDIGSPIRLPTAQWLLSDVFGIIDIVGRSILTSLKAEGLIEIDNGGWITVVI